MFKILFKWLNWWEYKEDPWVQMKSKKAKEIRSQNANWLWGPKSPSQTFSFKWIWVCNISRHLVKVTHVLSDRMWRSSRPHSTLRYSAKEHEFTIRNSETHNEQGTMSESQLETTADRPVVTIESRIIRNRILRKKKNCLKTKRH